jgi:tryptophan synthase alpha chain
VKHGGLGGLPCRLDALFAARRVEGKKVLVAYLCIGDPSIEESLELARACIRAGADVLELGVPFSDPSADGPTIARAGQRAIAAGGGYTATLGVARALREESDTPMVLFGYYNPIFVRGEARAVKEAADAGADALLVVDLPIDASTAMRDEAATHGVAIIPMLAPTSSPDRIERVRDAATKWPIGFVYYVSVAGVTGTAAVRADEAGARAAALRADLGLPVVVGFGIDCGEKARDAGAHVDGVVVGTAIVRLIEEGKTPEERLRRVTHLVAELRLGLDGGLESDREASASR